MTTYDVSNEDFNELSSALENSVDTASEPTTTTTQPEGQSAAPTTPTQEPSKQADLFEYDWNGKTIRESVEMAKKRAGMGYDYAQKVAELNKQMADIEKVRQQNAELSKWSEYDKYARENPKWAEHVKEMYEKRSQYSDPNLDPNDPLVQRIGVLEQMIESKLSGLDTKCSTYDNWIKSQTEEREDTALSTEIQSIREKHPDIDFSVRDENGKSLEMQVLEHMRDNRIPSFRAGFRDFYHDRLIQSQTLKAKEQVASHVQKNQKKGVVSTSSTPHGKAFTPNQIAKMGWNDVHELAKQEFLGQLGQ